MKLHFVTIIFALILYSQTNGQFSASTSYNKNLNLLVNPAPETSIDFKKYGSSDGIPWMGEYGITETIAVIMEREMNQLGYFLLQDGKISGGYPVTDRSRIYHHQYLHDG